MPGYEYLPVNGGPNVDFSGWADEADATEARESTSGSNVWVPTVLIMGRFFLWSASFVPSFGTGAINSEDQVFSLLDLNQELGLNRHYISCLISNSK